MVVLGEGISAPVNRRVRELLLRLERRPVEGLLDLMPSYRSLLLVYDPLRIPLEELQGKIMETFGDPEPEPLPEPRTHRIPVCYGGEYGPDLEWVARYHGITPDEVVRLHTGSVYQVYMIGFAPGFPYLGELPEGLATPRKQTPRTAVPKGSVAIAQRQTGIYPSQSPGGWQVLGRTPLNLFDPGRRPPVPLEMGDRVDFYPIREKEMCAWRG
jgi:KipI family sensor histidine kinase inhibitor